MSILPSNFDEINHNEFDIPSEVGGIAMPKLELIEIIEDNDADVAIISRILRLLVAHVAIVAHSSGERALEYLQQAAPRPQLILLDLSLPGMDGFEFIRQMREIKRLDTVLIVIITGAAMDIARAHAAEVAAGYLVKTVDSEKFAEQFKELLIRLGFEI